MMRLLLCQTVLAVALALIITASASADWVILADGSKIVGKIERMTPEKLTIATDFAGKLEIETAKVASFSTYESVNVAMKSGDRLVGPLQGEEAGTKATVGTQMGPIAVDVTQIDGLWPEGADSPEQIAAKAEVAAMEEELAKKAPKWSATLEAGIVSKEGNTDRLQARGRGELRRQSEKDLLKFFLSGDYSEEDDVRNTSEVKAGTYYEYLITERLFAHIGSTVEYDEFENLDLRWITTGGPGYYFIKEDDHELKGRVGLGFQHESFFDGETTDEAMAEIGVDYRLDIATWLQFINSTVYQPSFEGLDDYRLVSDSGLLIPLGNSDLWKLKLGALYEYNSMPQAGVERLDQTYYANIVLDIK